ncbi:MAG: cytochrome c biogenesis protein CcdA [Chitinophagales bacterium]
MQDYFIQQQTVSFFSFFLKKNNPIGAFRSIVLAVLFLLFPMLSKAALEQHITWKSSVEKISETEYNVKFSCNLDDDWHTFSQFTKEGGPLPTQFRFEKNKDIELIGKVQEIAKKHTKFDELFGVDVTSFDGDVTFVQKVKIKTPTAILKGEFDGQVCKDEVGCMPFGPEKFAISFDGSSVTTAAEKHSDTAAQIQSPTTQPPAVNATTLSDTAAKFDWSTAKNSCSINSETKDRSYLILFLLGFLGGLVALLTPCVFPMVPLTVSFFTKGGKDRKDGIKKALLYGVSIILIYVSLGLLITGIFGSDALNAMSTNIWFNLLFFVVFVAFAISFFGFYEITLPSSWANKTDSLSGRGGNIGIFFMAFTLALVSFSCTGPIIGTLLVEAATGGGPTLFNYIPIKPALGMFGFGLALALPFTLFALFPQWLKSLPKSGGWMTTVKMVLGFVELALAFKFLSTVDMTMNWGVLRFEPFMVIWILIFGIMTLYCLGIFFKNKPTTIVKGIGGVTLLFTLYLIYALVNYKPVSLFSGLIPPTSYNFKSTNEEKFKHFKDYTEGMAYAKQHNMPVLLDFTGFGCVNCRKIEDNVWTDEKVVERLKDYVVISLYVDDRKELPQTEWYTSDATGKEREVKTVGQKWSDFQARYFKTNSQPQYILLNTKEQLLNQPAAYDFSKNVDNYISFLDCGLKMNKQLK